MKAKGPVFRSVVLSNRTCRGNSERVRYLSLGSGGKSRRDGVKGDVFAICRIPHDSNERINWSCILSGSNTTERRL